MLFFLGKGQVFQSSFSYAPGFKLASGIKGEEWSVYAEYTWLRPRNSVTRNAPASGTTLGSGVWTIDSWFLQTGPLSKPVTGTRLSSDWDLDLNMVDLLAGNPLHKTKHLDFFGFIGLRSAWIDQTLAINAIEALASAGGHSFFPSQPITSSNKSHSWGIGPKGGIDTRYLLPQGFRIEGMFAASLLYTRFTDVKHSEDPITTLAIHPNGVDAKLGNYTSVRPNLELDLGIGWNVNWGRYGLDLSASYDFSIFWGQNVMRLLLDEFWAGTNAAAGDLYFEGMTATACFKF